MVPFQALHFTAAKFSIPRGETLVTKKLIIRDNGHVSVDAREAAEALAQHYANESRLAFSSSDKHFARVTRNQIKSCRDRPADNPLFNVDFTLPELSYALQNLDTNKSPGSDSIPGHLDTLEFWVGKDCYTYVTCRGKLPRQWKSAIVIPTHKPNKNAGLMTSYRPTTNYDSDTKKKNCLAYPPTVAKRNENSLLAKRLHYVIAQSSCKFEVPPPSCSLLRRRLFFLFLSGTHTEKKHTGCVLALQQKDMLQPRKKRVSKISFSPKQDFARCMRKGSSSNDALFQMLKKAESCETISLCNYNNCTVSRMRDEDPVSHVTPYSNIRVYIKTILMAN
ncbi:putative RNA-directed DNA polymerase from transposon BS [Trichonephila clavipes]|nr:putative RNA-directed DNA polymerase from transposon BS [Trichonephila clavipes]